MTTVILSRRGLAASTEPSADARRPNVGSVMRSCWSAAPALHMTSAMPAPPSTTLAIQGANVGGTLPPTASAREVQSRK